ncbi:DUF3644 domain-containing protein [Kitasatospora sp. NPDC053057]|uniref:DUF3644 domain-containing protein n=1 Tax=Kitasatospora sp. NPDC053057 TaxID=3364062 RepID=UPI0037C8AC30
MARPKKHWSMVHASQDEACLASRLYNDPAEVRSFEGFVVHMHLAWLYLLHAELTRDGTDFRYHQKDHPRFLEKVDGEPKCWELTRCVRDRWPDTSDPVRLNIEFFIGLRNKIEHRHARQQQALTAVLGGYAQALLLNYEEEMITEFGPAVSLATRLQFPVFIGSFTDAGEQSLRRLRNQLPATLRKFIADFRSGLSDETEADSRFELRLRLVNELAPRDPAALALQFTRYDDMTAEQQVLVEDLGRRGLVIRDERKRDIVGHGLKKPGEIVKEVAAVLPYIFNMTHFSKAWRALQVRPPTGSARPEITIEKYCVYDERHKDYGYTPAYAKKLIRECTSEEGFRNLLDTAPKDKVTGDWVGQPPPYVKSVATPASESES